MGELDQAEPLLRAALEKRPFDPVVLFHLGEVLRQHGKTAEAAKYLDEHKRVSALQQRRKYLQAQCALRKSQPADLLELGRICGQLVQSSRMSGAVMEMFPETITSSCRIFKATVWPRPISSQYPQVTRQVGIMLLPKAVAGAPPVVGLLPE